MKKIWMVVLLSVLMACAPQARVLNETEKNAVLAYSESKTDNLMQGINQNDYAMFSRDFSDQMKNAIPQTGLNDLRNKVIAKIGNYVSRRVDRVEEIGGNVAVVYNAKFEKDEPVALRVVFESAEPHRITGLWFDSAKLRQP